MICDKMSNDKFGKKFWLTVLFLFLIATVVYYILISHTIHILAYSSYIIVIIFVLAHIFMHRGHNHGDHGNHKRKHNSEQHEHQRSTEFADDDE